jgi:hypothetical protein
MLRYPVPSVKTALLTLILALLVSAPGRGFAPSISELASVVDTWVGTITYVSEMHETFTPTGTREEVTITQKETMTWTVQDKPGSQTYKAEPAQESWTVPADFEINGSFELDSTPWCPQPGTGHTVRRYTESAHASDQLMIGRNSTLISVGGSNAILTGQDHTDVTSTDCNGNTTQNSYSDTFKNVPDFSIGVRIKNGQRWAQGATDGKQQTGLIDAPRAGAGTLLGRDPHGSFRWDLTLCPTRTG